jgi:hypothetical protein
MHANAGGLRKRRHGHARRLAGKMNRKYGAHSSVDFLEGQRWYNIFRR